MVDKSNQPNLDKDCIKKNWLVVYRYSITIVNYKIYLCLIKIIKFENFYIEYIIIKF